MLKTESLICFLLPCAKPKRDRAFAFWIARRIFNLCLGTPLNRPLNLFMVEPPFLLLPNPLIHTRQHNLLPRIMHLGRLLPSQMDSSGFRRGLTGLFDRIPGRLSNANAQCDSDGSRSPSTFEHFSLHSVVKRKDAHLSTHPHPYQ